MLIARIFVEVQNKEKKEKGDVSAVTSETEKGRWFNFRGKNAVYRNIKVFKELLYFSLTVMIRVKILFSPAD